MARLYDIAVRQGKVTSGSRLDGLANYCVQQLAARGLANAEANVRLPGGGREKEWDVAWKLHGKYRLAISLKSILRNLSGTIPNRIDDMMGEVANLQMYSPEVVIGYVMILDVSQDSHSSAHGANWSAVLRSRLAGLSSRKAPSWSVGMIEAFAIVEVDFSAGANLVSGQQQLMELFDSLAREVLRRNPRPQ